MFGSLYTLEYLYPVTYTATFLPSILLRNYSTDVSISPLIRCLNSILIEKYAYLWFTIVYSCCLLAYCSSDWKISFVHIKRFALKYFLNSIFYINVVVWCFGPSVFSRINMATGGVCKDDPSLTPHQCSLNKGQWINGFDSSGHLYIIISSSLLIWRECLNLISRNANTSDSPEEFEFSWCLNSRNYNRLYKSFLLAFSMCLLSAWYMMLVVTCLFFHTPLEKLVGMFFAYAIPLLSEGL